MQVTTDGKDALAYTTCCMGCK